MKLIIWDFRNTIYNTETKEFNEGALDALKMFENDRQVLVTFSSDPETRIKQIRKLGIDGYFIDIVITLKTREVFQKILERFDGSHEDVYVIGDRYESEISIGNDLNLRTIWLSQNQFYENNGNLKYWKKINSLTELKSLN